MASFHLLQQIENRLSWFKQVPLLPHLIDEQLKIVTLLFRPSVFRQMIEVTHELKRWPQVTTHYHRYGGLEFRVNGTEIGHLHGNGLLDVRFNQALKEKLMDWPWIKTHHVLTQTSGWISIYTSRKTNTQQLVRVLRWSYQFHSAQTTANELAEKINAYLKP